MSRTVYKPEQFAKDENGNLKVAGDTKVDRDGRWIVRADSRRVGYDLYFTGAGDRFDTMEIGGGTQFRFDFNNPTDYPLVTEGVPTGYKRIRVDWQFNDSLYLKEGTLFNYNAPMGSYVDLKFVCPAGYPYERKIYGTDVTDNINIAYATEDTVAAVMVMKYFIEGSVPMGDELNTEACTDTAIPSYMIWRFEITIPEVTGWQDCHGHWSLEIYRPCSVYFAD